MSNNLTQADFIGVWQRESLRIEKGCAFEDSNVLWLHAGDYFADLRWAKSGESQVRTSAFAGKASWDAPRMQFYHELDLTKEMTQDVGTLSFLEDKLIECGQVTIKNKVIKFEETWIQLGKADREDCQVAQKLDESGSGYIVRVGEFVIAMEESGQQFSAAAWKYVKEDWDLLFGQGECESLCTLGLALTTNTLPSQWQVRI